MAERKYYPWIDFLKGIAILGVLTNHTIFIHKNFLLLFHTAFSVPMFFLVSGFTMSTSLAHMSNIDSKYMMKRFLRIFIPYMIATIAHQVFMDNYVFDFKKSLNFVLNFNGNDAFYFVLIYIQFVFIAPVVYRIANRHSSIAYDIFMIFVFSLISLVCLEHTVMFSFEAGKYLFGGTYLLVFYMGFVLFKWHPRICAVRSLNIVFLVISIAIIAWMELDSNSILRLAWSNPPSKYTIAYLAAVFFLCYGLINIVAGFNAPRILEDMTYPIRFLGTISLYIFIYHSLVFSVIKRYDEFFVPMGKHTPLYNEYMIFIHFALAILLPLLIKFAFKRINWRCFLSPDRIT